MKEAPLIFEIKGNSLDDGPGIRTVVFFKGCPLDCVWCHNPEGKKTVEEISFDPRACIGCGACLDVCGEKALSRKNRYYIDRKRCTLCFACVESCPSGALSRVGIRMSVPDIMKKVVPDKPFFDNSGGGVTLSGGEPSLFMDYASGLLKKLKEEGIHTLMETCGLFRFDAFKEKLLPYLDAVYFDIKIHDGKEHLRYCGVPNGTILENFGLLLRAVSGGCTAILPRIPIVPGLTDSDANLAAIAGFLRDLDVHRAAVLPYNPLWFEKCEKIGRDRPFQSDAAKRTWIGRERLQRAKAIIAGHDICPV